MVWSTHTYRVGATQQLLPEDNEQQQQVDEDESPTWLQGRDRTSSSSISSSYFGRGGGDSGDVDDDETTTTTIYAYTYRARPDHPTGSEDDHRLLWVQNPDGTYSHTEDDNHVRTAATATAAAAKAAAAESDPLLPSKELSSSISPDAAVSLEQAVLEKKMDGGGRILLPPHHGTYYHTPVFLPKC